jgi:hypothetical protein
MSKARAIFAAKTAVRMNYAAAIGSTTVQLGNRRRWPGNADLFARVKDDGRAEVALIAAAGLLRKGAPP